MKLSLTAAALSFAAVNADVLQLTPSNFSEMTAGKTVFIKFFAPWCGHCKKMAPDWEKLAGDWDSDKIGLIAEVDCTDEASRPLCDANGVKGFPTLKYGDANDLQDYKGGRTYDDLSSFAKTNLVPICSPSNLDLCDDEKKAEIAKFAAMSSDELDALIAAEEKKIADADTAMKEGVEELQKTYEQLNKDKEATIEAVKASGLGLMKACKASASA
uniref:Thioredoxin domain-containing protein n=1 Tax=Leptocylindrus danicus TaxID=163516 RepID=A0A7S2P6K7_9STRA|mmetsp:Transcript_24527/g.36747  ORF Transcript_24527/g.36747 Transcript_24527/m.36747 type:complete len:215 (+) Transcript_24527:69-713(+)